MLKAVRRTLLHLSSSSSSSSSAAAAGTQSQRPKDTPAAPGAAAADSGSKHEPFWRDSKRWIQANVDARLADADTANATASSASASTTPVPSPAPPRATHAARDSNPFFFAQKNTPATPTATAAVTTAAYADSGLRWQPTATWGVSGGRAPQEAVRRRPRSASLRGSTVSATPHKEEPGVSELHPTPRRRRSSEAASEAGRQQHARLVSKYKRYARAAKLDHAEVRRLVGEVMGEATEVEDVSSTPLDERNLLFLLGTLGTYGLVRSQADLLKYCTDGASPRRRLYRSLPVDELEGFVEGRRVAVPRCSYLYSVLLKGKAVNRESSLASFHAFWLSIPGSVKDNQALYNTALKRVLSEEAGRPLAAGLLKEMKQRHVPRGDVTYGCLLSSVRTVDEGMALYRRLSSEAKEDGLRRALQTFLRAVSKTGGSAACLDVIRRVDSCPNLVHVVEGTRSQSGPAGVAAVLRRGDSSKVQRVCNIVLGALKKEGDHVRLVRLYEYMASAKKADAVTRLLVLKHCRDRVEAEHDPYHTLAMKVACAVDPSVERFGLSALAVIHAKVRNTALARRYYFEATSSNKRLRRMLNEDFEAAGLPLPV
eukprot:Rhum_TRINITY_DN8454_c0_g2::Rhum_TRINITY_DN8454_c0_g2_i1::g.27986::m.27986